MHFLPRRPYGNPACKDSKGFCAGHYIMPEEHFGRYGDETLKTAPPPTEVLKEMFDRGNTEDASAKVFLPHNEARPCCIYLEHVYYVVT